MHSFFLSLDAMRVARAYKRFSMLLSLFFFSTWRFSDAICLSDGMRGTNIACWKESNFRVKSKRVIRREFAVSSGEAPFESALFINFRDLSLSLSFCYFFLDECLIRVNLVIAGALWRSVKIASRVQGSWSSEKDINWILRLFPCLWK